MRHVFIIGCKGIPSNYGGFETFVDNLVCGQQSENIKYHVFCMDNRNYEEEYHGAHCVHLKIPNLGPARAVMYDWLAFRWSLAYMKQNKILNPLVYVLACRIGPFVGGLCRKLHALGGIFLLNPDGHEWKRAKWNWLVRKYWKQSERLMVKRADQVICDSKNIVKYIEQEYERFHKDCTFIAYGTSRKTGKQSDEQRLKEWLGEWNLVKDGYYLVVGRFVPENNYETILREFCQSGSKRKLVLITNVVQNKFYRRLEAATGFSKDERVCFAGTVYDPVLLQLIRENAYGYLHGHEVGGTNPSLLESLSATDVNLLCDVSFNREVAEDTAWYWEKTDGRLRQLIEQADRLSLEEKQKLGESAKRRMGSEYSWSKIISEYEELFLRL